ncbi:MAG TPA: type VI secretion system contractile sheath large subunit, partial [Pyrinomonadaceae bacterium]|nr:type VI secretion system contractile sheath large subunit [Pyrinomonadaceae bacterium]
MSEPFSFGGIEVHLASRGAEADTRPDAEVPFRILLVGDFSGRASRGEAVEPGELAARRPFVVDRDNFDEVMRRLGVRLRLDIGGRRLDLYFDALEDFHPDRLYERLEVFRPFRQTRRRLQDPSTFDAAAAEVRRWTSADESGADATAREAPPSGSSSAGSSSRDLIAQMLDAKGSSESPAGAGARKPSAGAPSELSSSDFARFVREVVGPHLVADTGDEEEELTRVVDEAVGSSMRAVLHDSAFQSLEAAWRGVRFLAHRLDTGSHLKLYLLDLTRAELEADLRSSDDLTRTALYKLLVEQTVGTHGGEPWALLAGVYT